MQHVTLIDNPLDPTAWERLEVEDVRAFLMDRYPEWPPGARIYHGGIGDDHDVTPATEADVERLAELDDLTVIIYPEHPSLLLIALVVVVVLAVSLVFLLPSIPKVNTQVGSSNNSLATRTNSPRPNERIPDIFGAVRSVPDLLGVTYRVYEDDREVEIAYMCVGRGAYLIEDVRDGDTLISEIAGASVAVYAPYTSPNNFMAPQLQIGTAISDPVFDVARLNEVNGQTLDAPNSNAVKGDAEIKFRDGGIIEASGGAIDFTAYFTAGQTIDIGNGAHTGLTDAASAIFAAATGIAPNKISFATFNPADHFTAGSSLILEQAVWTYTDDGTGGGGGGGGDLGGGTTGGGPDNPEYPGGRFQNDIPLE